MCESQMRVLLGRLYNVKQSQPCQLLAHCHLLQLAQHMCMQHTQELGVVMAQQR